MRKNINNDFSDIIDIEYKGEDSILNFDFPISNTELTLEEIDDTEVAEIIYNIEFIFIP